MTRASLPIALIAAAAVAGCTTSQSFDPNDPNRQMRTGALAGAAAGALLGGVTAGGSSVGDRNRALAIGALAGAATGAAIGNQLDRQARELRTQLGNEVGIVNTGDRLVVTMPQDILFATDSATLRPTLQQDIRTVGQSLLAYPNTTVQVVGHTDSDGSAAYNQDLSQRRAAAVTRILRAEGVPGSRLRSIGRGEEQPVASNLTPEGKAQNRRVEIVILPNAA